MPPRIRAPAIFRGFGAPSRTPSIFPSTCFEAYRCPFSTTNPHLGSRSTQKRKSRDPYSIAQAKQRKAANLARQEVLRKEREAPVGDPVRGTATPFLESLDNPLPFVLKETHVQSSSATTTGSPNEEPSTGFSPSQASRYKLPEVESALEYSRSLTRPVAAIERSTADPVEEDERIRQFEEKDRNAEAAVSRIAILANISRAGRSSINIRRCIETFGRHNTDEVLAPKPSAKLSEEVGALQTNKTPRIGPDTGSSEVQIAILTTKIRAILRHIDGFGKQDKVAKRRLRTMVHQRQKLMKYLRRKERGGERWQNVVNTLGLTDSMWKGEIVLPR